MKTRISTLLISAALLSALSACSYIKSLFPDKEKDYQYTIEIPPLILPADLKKSQIPGATTSASSAPPLSADAALPPVAVNAPVQEAASAAPAIKGPTATALAPVDSPETEPGIPDTAITLERINNDKGENRLHINVPFTRAWRIVNKALSRKAIEVTERNQEAKLITVEYDPDEQQVEDGTYWDELKFMFSGIQANEKTYLLKLEENNQQTDIVVVDEEQQVLSDAASVKLLTVLEETIKADLASK